MPYFPPASASDATKLLNGKIYARQYRARNKEKISVRRKAAYAESRDAICEQRRASYAANPHTIRAASRAYRAANAEQSRLRVIEFHKSNPEWKRLSHSRRRAVKQNAPGGGISPRQWDEIRSQALGICAYCNQPAPLTLDHIEPLFLGGAHDPENAAAVCVSCNCSKGRTPLLTWLVRRMGDEN